MKEQRTVLFQKDAIILWDIVQNPALERQNFAWPEQREIGRFFSTLCRPFFLRGFCIFVFFIVRKIMDFELVSSYKPTGDQPEAIEALAQGIREGVPYQTLLGVTGSGKTFTVANVIERVRKPALILSHNKTLAAQLYSEFKSFFPHNAVEYFVSYYDYYQPEAYLPTTDTYIEKDMAINEEIDKLRLRATASLLSGRRDVIVVSSVSCLYGMADPRAFEEQVVYLEKGMRIARDALYVNNKVEFTSGSFRVNGDTVDIFPAIESYDGLAYRIEFWGDEIERIASFNPVDGHEYDEQDTLNIYPTNLFVTTQERIRTAIGQIHVDLGEQVRFLQDIGKPLEAKRLEERVTYDLEMIQELGHCAGIENYSRYLDGRQPGERPFCLLDYFPKDFLLVIDESHVTVPQIRAMYGGDRSRKQTLVEYGFRLPAALDNRPQTFEEFESLTPSAIYVSATPADYELMKSEGVVVEQLIRPTGLLDPIIEVRPSLNQIDDLMEEIEQRATADERVLVTTLTKRMAEELTDYLKRMEVRCNYIHSDVDTLERVKIMDDLRKGLFDVLIGVNLLREGLDLPEVSLVAVLDADKEGFLRSHRSLTQTAGRAARNINGKVIFYADKITESMQQTIDETNRRREKQLAYNERHGITPKQIVKNTVSVLGGGRLQTATEAYAYVEPEPSLVADPVVQYMTRPQLEKAIAQARKQMTEAAKKLDFLEAAQYRDEMLKLQDMLDQKTEEK